jgi:prophage maintenance system killer protein
MIKLLRRKPKKWLTLEDCESLYNAFKSTAVSRGLEPIPPFSTRYFDVLESILGSVEQTWNKKHLNPTVLDAASTYFNKFVRSQCFPNGNKRMGILFTHFFLIIHGIDFEFSSNELFNFAATIAGAAENGIKPEETLKWCRKIIRQFTKEK